MRCSRRLQALLLLASLPLLPGRSGADGFSTGDLNLGYEAAIGLQAPCHSCTPIMSENIVVTPTQVSAYMHAEGLDLTDFVGFTMTSSLVGQVKMDGRSIAHPSIDALYAGFPGITLDDTLTPHGPTTNGVYALSPHLEITGEIILDHFYDTNPPGNNGTMQVRFSILDAATSNPCPGYGVSTTLPVDAPFDLTLGSSECDVPQGGAIRYSIWLGEVGGGANHGQISNAEVHLADTATVFFGLPDGVTLSSASGAFVNTP